MFPSYIVSSDDKFDTVAGRKSFLSGGKGTQKCVVISFPRGKAQSAFAPCFRK